MSADISEKPTDCEGSGLQELQGGSGPNDTLPLLDRDEILRKRRERRKTKKQEQRRLRYHLSRRGGLKLVSERMFNTMKAQSKSDHHYAKIVDLILESAAKAKKPQVTKNVKSHSHHLNKVNRGKTRENPRRCFTKLKKKLLKFRWEKLRKTQVEVAEKLNEVVLDTNKESAKDPLKLPAGNTPKVVETHDVLTLDIPKQPAEVSSKLPTFNILKVVEKFDNLTLQRPKEPEGDPLTSAANIPKVLETFNALALETKKRSGDDFVKLPSPNIHSRTFRSYCDNTTSKEICDLTENLLRKLFNFQKRAFEKNVIKARAHRRYVVGFNEVQRLVMVNKAKLVIIAPDCEATDFPGGLDEMVNTLKCKCKERDIPYIFSLKRRALAYCLFRKVPVSCVAIGSYDGAQELFQQLMDVLTIEREKYASLF